MVVREGLVFGGKAFAGSSFKEIHHAQALLVMPEPGIRYEFPIRRIERLLAGMTEGWMAKIVRERNGLG